MEGMFHPNLQSEISQADLKPFIIGYYDNVIFHRIVPGFIVQTGDPTGTGTGGESFYGEPFEDEVHGRLRFNRFFHLMLFGKSLR